MTENKQLQEEQLKEVSGGLSSLEERHGLKMCNEINRNELVNYIGQEIAHYDFTHKRFVAYGTLIGTGETSFGCSTRPACFIRVHEGCKHEQYTTSEGYAICPTDVGRFYTIIYL